LETETLLMFNSLAISCKVIAFFEFIFVFLLNFTGKVIGK
jgi:hypothetical protein